MTTHVLAEIELPVAATLTGAELSTPFVAPIGVASEGGQIILSYKPPGSQKVHYWRFNGATDPWSVEDLGPQAGAWVKSGDGGVGFYGPQRKAIYFSTESPTTEGALARVVASDEVAALNFPPPASGGASAATVAQHEARLDWVAYQAGVTGNALNEAAAALAQASAAVAAASAALIEMANKARG